MAIKAKKQAWKNGGSRELCQIDRRYTGRQVHVAMRETEVFLCLVTRQLLCDRRETSPYGWRHIAFNDSAEKEAWKFYYEKLVNIENEWEVERVPDVDPTEGLAIWIDSFIVDKDTKTGKAPGPSGITTEMLKTPGEWIMV